MAEYCISCNKKIGFWDDPDIYVAEEKPLCSECSKPVTTYFSKLYKCNAIELAGLEKELADVCENTYSEEVATLIVNKFCERRMQMGLLTDDEKAEKTKKEAEFEEKVMNLPMTTTNNFEGYRITKYVKVVSEEIIFKNSFWKRLDAGLEDLGRVTVGIRTVFFTSSFLPLLH